MSSVLKEESCSLVRQQSTVAGDKLVYVTVKVTFSHLS